MPDMRILTSTSVVLALASLLAAGCGDDGVDSDEEARRAYLGLDASISKSLALGLQGFNQADSANIADQNGTGDLSGTIVVGGQVDQGSSDNKGLRLEVTMTDYSDGLIQTEEDGELEITYDTDPAAPSLVTLTLRNVPDGTFDGTVIGTYLMTGDIEGSVTLNLVLTGTIESDGAGGTRRVVGDTTVTGTATNDDDGTYDVDLTI